MKIPADLRVYGDVKFRGPCEKEDYVLTSFISYLRKNYPDSYGALAFHVQNEGKRTPAQAMRDKSHGLLKGVSDVIIPARVTLVLELKKADSSQCAWETGQREFLAAAAKTGAFACVAFGYEAAIQAFEDWLKIVEGNQLPF